MSGACGPPCQKHHSPGRNMSTKPGELQMGNTTPTDPRSQRNRAGRRGGLVHSRTRSPYLERPALTGVPMSPCPDDSNAAASETGPERLTTLS